MPTPKFERILNTLEQTYGRLRPAGPSDAYEMIVYLNCGYPATDASCAKGFDALKKEVGTSPDQILKAPKSLLAKLMRLGGIVSELRAQRMKGIARKAKMEFGGDLKAAVKRKVRSGQKQDEKNIRGGKKILQEFPTIGEPSAEKILLFAGLVPVAAVPSACVGVPVRLFVGEEGRNYAADYRVAREILDNGLPISFQARQRAYLLLKRHGHVICKRSTPRCAICPVTAECAYFQREASDQSVK